VPTQNSELLPRYVPKPDRVVIGGGDDALAALAEKRDPEPVMAEVDPIVLRRAVTNLVDNAIKYGPAKSDVAVAVARHDGVATISVTDAGPGIPREHRDRIFERFYRVDPARSRQGAGLGLAIARAGVEAHGGTLDLAPDGRGTTFVVRLPATGSD
jgi:signal transduction histidine kinase